MRVCQRASDPTPQRKSDGAPPSSPPSLGVILCCIVHVCVSAICMGGVGHPGNTRKAAMRTLGARQNLEHAYNQHS